MKQQYPKGRATFTGKGWIVSSTRVEYEEAKSAWGFILALGILVIACYVLAVVLL